jgi:hypothetical protein
MMNRTKPAPLISMAMVPRTPTFSALRIRFAEPELEVPEDIGFEEEELFVDETPRFGTPCVSAIESQYKFGSTCCETLCPYEILEWSPQTPMGRFRNHCSVGVWLLLAACVSTFTTWVSNCQNN